MTKTDEATVEEWLTMLAVSCDPESPFAGMVDLSGIFALPLEVQRKIYDRLTPGQIELIKRYYGPKEEAK